MTKANPQTRTLHTSTRTLILIGSLAALLGTVACSEDPSPSVVKAASPAAKPAVLNLSASQTTKSVPLAVAETNNVPAKPIVPKQIAFSSRDYGISLDYPWQYTALRAKAIAQGADSLQPRPDGSDDQFSLIRIEVPKGFYPDTDLDTAYLTVSLNQDIDQEQCEAIVSSNGARVDVMNINGIDYKWSETSDGGRGSSSKIRNYVAFQNDTCYELEAGVKTTNDHGQSKEVNSDQVFARLDGMLKTVKLQGEAKQTSDPELKKAAELESPRVKN
jgi:hypothetical protein